MISTMISNLEEEHLTSCTRYEGCFVTEAVVTCAYMYSHSVFCELRRDPRNRLEEVCNKY